VGVAAALRSSKHAHRSPGRPLVGLADNHSQATTALGVHLRDAADRPMSGLVLRRVGRWRCPQSASRNRLTIVTVARG